MFDEKYLDTFKNIFTFWDKLTNQEQETLRSSTTLATYDKGQIVHNGYNECIGILGIISGELRTLILSDEGREITLFRLNDNDTCVLSASCLLTSITFDVNIMAEKKTQVFLINATVLSKLMSQNVYFENFALRVSSDRFSDTMWTIQQILFMSFDRRLAIFISDESKKIKSDNIHTTHEQIAKYIGSAREVVSRMLKYFAQEGIVSLYRGGIKILDKEKLNQLINGNYDK